MPPKSPTYLAKAFVSCSLRAEDKNFVNYICEILKHYQIEPFGTVGLFSASPENPIVLMNKNIPLADLVVIVATPRYVQQDVATGKTALGLSEMVHVEAGMAIAYDKPVVVFVQEGTHVGNVLPNITQYIVLNGKEEDFRAKEPLISSLLNNAYQRLKKVKNAKAAQTIGGLALFGFAAYGGVKALENMLDKKKKSRRRK